MGTRKGGICDDHSYTLEGLMPVNRHMMMVLNQRLSVRLCTGCVWSTEVKFFAVSKMRGMWKT